MPNIFNNIEPVPAFPAPAVEYVPATNAITAKPGGQANESTMGPGNQFTNQPQVEICSAEALYQRLRSSIPATIMMCTGLDTVSTDLPSHFPCEYQYSFSGHVFSHQYDLDHVKTA